MNPSTARRREDVSTLLRERPDPITVRTATFTLTVLRGATPGRAFIVDGTRPSRVFVGSSPACELHVDDRHVSRRHVALDVHGDRLRVTDLHSKNGTFVDRIQVAEAYLRGGEVLTVGETALRVALANDGATLVLSPATRFGRVLGASVEMRRLYPSCERLATSDLPVVVEGETGTGKELLAESLHEAGPRSRGPLVVFDCAATPPALAEHLLFGCEAGALHAGSPERIGVFEAAHHGTLLIDEVGDLAPEIQPKLLRVLSRGEIRRAGAAAARRVDVRVIATTRRDLERDIQEGRFRDDLFFRLAAARVELPPLRHRQGDVRLLATHFWRALAPAQEPAPGGAAADDASDPPEELLRALEAHVWPGNVRELEHAVARARALGGDASHDDTFVAAAPSVPSNAPDFIDGVVARGLALAAARQHVVDEFERRYIADVLARHHGNVARAAAASGLARRYFQILRQRHGRG